MSPRSMADSIDRLVGKGHLMPHEAIAALYRRWCWQHAQVAHFAAHGRLLADIPPGIYQAMARHALAHLIPRLVLKIQSEQPIEVT